MLIVLFLFLAFRQLPSRSISNLCDVEKNMSIFEYLRSQGHNETRLHFCPSSGPQDALDRWMPFRLTKDGARD